jgi:hypothetical protein
MLGDQMSSPGKVQSMKPHYPEPSMKTGMGAPYLGYYAKTFHASSKDGNYRGKSTLT